jgi:hypothetical protein
VRLLVDQLLLIVSVTALALAGWRTAGPAVDRGLLRLAAAVPAAASVALISALVLGLFGLGASPVALCLVAVGDWLATRVLVAGHGPPASEQLVRWCAELPSWGRAARAALLGAAIGYLVWVLRYPVVGLDALADHLALPVEWVHNGAPGSLVTVNVAIPFQNFPVAHEVLVGWVIGISRTLSAAMLVTPATLVLLALSVRAGLKAVGVPSAIGWLATASAASVPIVVAQLAGPNNDLHATAWLACTAAIVAGSDRRPKLLAFAVLAAGLAVGTKTTPIPLALLVLAIGCWRSRSALRGVALPLAGACAMAIVTGGLWYLRDLIDHGAPLWPVSSAPDGDPVPPALRAIDPTFLAHVSATLHGRLEDYGKALAGGLVALLGALAAPLWIRRRASACAAVVVLVALLIWAASPYTGNFNSTILALGATRYMMPVLVAAIVAVALSGLWAKWPATILLAVALAVNLDRDWTLKFPVAPSPRELILAGAIAAATVLILETAMRTTPRIRSPVLTHLAPALMTVAAGTLVAALLVPADGFLSRHAATDQADSGLVRWLDSRAAFRSGHETVLVGPAELAVLTGARLGHRVTVLDERESCGTVRASLRDAWLVLERSPDTETYYGGWLGCLRGIRPSYFDQSYVAFAPPALSAGAGVAADVQTR